MGKDEHHALCINYNCKYRAHCVENPCSFCYLHLEGVKEKLRNNNE